MTDVGDVSDIEDLLDKAKKRAARIGWIKTAMVCGATMLGTAFGSGVVAGKYLNRILNGQEEMLRLIRGQDDKISGQQDAIRVIGERVAANDKVCDGATQCCREQARRVDILYQQPMMVRR